MQRTKELFMEMNIHEDMKEIRELEAEYMNELTQSRYGKAKEDTSGIEGSKRPVQ